MDVETGAIIGVSVHGAYRADTDTVEESLETARANLEQSGIKTVEPDEGDSATPSPEEGPSEAKRHVTALEAYNKATVLRRLKEKGYRTYIPERRQKRCRRWTDKGERRRPRNSTKTALGYAGPRERSCRDCEGKS